MGGDSQNIYVDNFCLKKENLNDGKFVINTPVGLQVKNIKFMLNGDVRIISENPSYHPLGGYDEEIKKADFNSLKILGCVVGLVMKS